MTMVIKLCCTEGTKNILVVSISMGLVYMALHPATSVQNIALAESTDIDLKVGYYASIFKTAGSILAGFVVQMVYQSIGLKLTFGLVILLITGGYWPMIWIVNEYVIYAGEFLSGIGDGAMWVLCPMVVMDNSREGKSLKNMGHWWAMMTVGVIVGGVCNYFYFEGVSTISASNRVMIYAICAGITVLSSIIATIGVSEIKDGVNRIRSTAVGSEEVTYVNIRLDCDQEDANDVFRERKKTGNSEEIKNDVSYSLKEIITWLQKMGGRLAFWMHFVPLLYWAFIWGFFYKIFPTAIPSISDERKLIPLTTVVMGITFIAGSSTSSFVSKWINSTSCILLATLMQLLAIILSILIFPKDSATRIIEVGTAETYIEPHNAYLIAISALIGLADSAVSVIYFNAAGRLYGEDTSLGYSVNILGYYVFYILSMFAPSILNIHSYCYVLLASVVAMCLSITVGLKNYL